MKDFVIFFCLGGKSIVCLIKTNDNSWLLRKPKERHFYCAVKLEFVYG